MRAQELLFLVNDQTTVSSVRFRFVDTQTFTPKTLQMQMVTKAPGFFERGWRKSIASVLPLFGEPGVYPFNPIELQKDVIRLERYYARNGFPRAELDYLARLDTARNAISLLLSVQEGPPVLIDTLRFAGPGGRPAFEQFDATLREDWVDFRDRIALQQGERLDDFRLIQLQDQTLGWLRNHGYAFADVSAESRVDSVALRADVRIKMTAGPRGRYGEIVVDGAESVDNVVVRRELPFRPGEPFEQSELTEGQRQLFGLNLFQLAAVNVAPDQPPDSTVDVIVRVREGPARVISGLGGYYSDGGLTGSAQWTHRNFFGGARAFTASARAQTGLAAVSLYPATEYEARLSLRQPFLFNRYISATVEPFARYRDDVIERAQQVGLTTALLYERGPLRTAALAATLSARTIGSDSLRLTDLASLLPGDAFSVATSQLRLSATFGAVDDPLRPRSGFIVRPAVAAAGLLLSDATYGSTSLTATAFVPLGERMGVTARISGGLLFPLAGTDPALAEDYLAVRDVLLYAGGTNDVRGWATSLLGPKFIDVTSVDTSITLAEVDNDVLDYYRRRYGVRYAPVGSEGKLSGALQVNLPFPFFGPQWGASAFLDAGTVLNPADGLYALFENAATEFPGLPALVGLFQDDTTAVRIGTGAGIQYLTPIGFVTFSIGVKLNPSFFDLRDPAELFRAADIEDIVPGPPDFSTVDPQWYRRLQFHLSIGQRF